MADYIRHLQKNNKKPTRKEEEIVEDLSTYQESKSVWKSALIISSFAFFLHFPVFKNIIKSNFNFFKTNDYYYVITVTLIIFIISFITIYYN